MQPIELVAEGLLLRAWQPEDADAVYAACQDPLIQRWTNVPAPYLPQHATDLVERLTTQGWRSGQSTPLGVFDATTGALLGAHGLTHLNLTIGVSEMGTWVAPWARGHHVAERATRAVARWATDILGLRQVIWRAEIGNHASRLVAQRVGFVFDPPARDLIPHRDGDLRDGWRGTLRPGEVLPQTPPWLAHDSVCARRAMVFGSPQPTLRSGDVTVRPLTDDDADPMIAACSDPESIRWTNIHVPFTRTEAETAIRVFAPGQWARGEGGVFAVAGPSGQYAGRIDLHLSYEDPMVGSVGYLIAPSARGRGYATTAVRAVCAWAFENLRLARVEWRAHLGNLASRRVAAKAGFVEEGVLRRACPQRGERRDAWVAALLATPPSA